MTNFTYTIVYLTLMKTTVLGVHGHLLDVNHCHYEYMVIWYSLVFKISVCFTHWQAISKEKGSTLYIHVYENELYVVSSCQTVDKNRIDAHVHVPYFVYLELDLWSLRLHILK